MHHFVIATAGHVDHGKSALVQALTGTDPDRLPEEKARGITIQLGFAHVTFAPSATRVGMQVGVVDVPGHEDFVKNMVGGVGSIDLALFVVAADDGWMPQTEEHLQILSYLGVSRAVVALTKVDLIGAREEAVRNTVRAKLMASPFADAPIVATSVLTRHGLENLQETLRATLETVPPQGDAGKPRLPIDRVFTLRGIGVVVTGTLTGGTFSRGQTVTIVPGGRSARIRSVQNYNREIETALPGTRTALNLPDISAQTETEGRGRGVQRGQVVTLAQLGSAHDIVDVVLQRSARIFDAKNAAPTVLKRGKRVRVHHGSGNFPARVLMKGEGLTQGGQALAQLQLDAPLFAFAGDRFIVRDWAEQRTLAGGTVLDPDANRGEFHTARQQAFLIRRASDGGVRTYVLSQLIRDGAVQQERLLVKSRFSAAQISDMVGALVTEGEAVVAGGLVAEARWWSALLTSAAEAIGAWHHAHPEQIGMPINELRALIEGDREMVGVFDAVIAALCASVFQQVSSAMAHRAHRPALPAHLQRAGETLRAALGAKPFEPPARRDLAGDAVKQQALRFLIQTGEAIEIGPELVLSAESFVQAKEAVRSFLRANGAATVSALREALRTNRRVIVPLLEHLDRLGITRRAGDKRVLRE